jgi:hypothetical protein
VKSAVVQEEEEEGAAEERIADILVVACFLSNVRT